MPHMIPPQRRRLHRLHRSGQHSWTSWQWLASARADISGTDQHPPKRQRHRTQDSADYDAPMRNEDDDDDDKHSHVSVTSSRASSARHKKELKVFQEEARDRERKLEEQIRTDALRYEEQHQTMIQEALHYPLLLRIC